MYTDRRYRPQIEHTYRFDQEQGWDVEGMRVGRVARFVPSPSPLAILSLK